MLRPAAIETAVPKRASWFRHYPAVAVLGLLAAAPVNAMHCGSAVISNGDTVDKLLEFCGEPESVKTYPIVRTPVDPNGRVYHGFREELRVEEWTYNFGPTQLMTKVRIEYGYVTDVRYLGYGH
ncbi:MAG TPA: DUF2845 domain-containing protein [Gammaproteobacteria bacterium]|nr:DUF2845 domain-containing protein [Gammaproteobacteria bacterium]